MTETSALAKIVDPYDPYDEIDDFRDWGIRALFTTRGAGTFSTAGEEPVARVLGRWEALQRHLFGDRDDGRLATARQVHGARVLVHETGWTGWLRGPGADGHLSYDRGTAMAVSVADCVPVFVAHPSGAAAVLHSGWRGTEADIVGVAIRLLVERGADAADLRLVLGPAVCGACYEVSPDVYGRLTGKSVQTANCVDLRGIIARRAEAAGVRDVRSHATCTRCDNDRFYSHRSGDSGRQLGVLLAER